MSLNEIKCSDFWANDKLNIFGYNVILKCRTNMGGGVAFLIKDNISFVESNIDKDFMEEIIGFSCKINNFNISFFSYYNPPNREINVNIFNYIQSYCTHYLIMGDLNAKNTIFNSKRNNKNGCLLESILLNNNCQVINETYDPTFHILKQNGQNYGEFLDLFLGSPLLANIAMDYKVIKSGLDSCQAVMFHSVIQICLSHSVYLPPSDGNIGKNKKKFLFEKANWIKFKTHLDKLNTNDFFPLSIEDKLKLITSKINEATEQSIPSVLEDLQTKSALPKSILLNIKERNRLQSKYKKDRTSENKKHLYEKVEKIRSMIKEFKSTSWKKFLGKFNGSHISSKPFWSRINRIRNKKQPKNIPDIKHNGVILSTDSEKANAFANKLFTTFNSDDDPVFNELQKRFVDSTVKEYFHKNNQDPFEPFSINELNSALKKLNNKTSLDADMICNRMLKKNSKQLQANNSGVLQS